MDLLWFKKVILKLIAKSKNKIRMLINIRGTKQKLGKIVLSTRNIGWDSESVIIRSAMKNILMSQKKTAKTTYIYILNIYTSHVTQQLQRATRRLLLCFSVPREDYEGA